MQITLNGNVTDTACKFAFELKGGSDIVILNGYQLSEDAALNSGDVVCVIKKGVMPSKNELESMMTARHTPRVHDKVKCAKVAIAGLGGLGSHIAAALARLGVGELLLVDHDVVEPSNLNRQHYCISHLGLKKTEALKRQLADINCFIDIKTIDAYITQENVTDLFKGYGIVCEALDNPQTKAMLVGALLSNFADVKVVAASGMAGFGSSNDIKTEVRFGRLYTCGDKTSEAAAGNGLMSPRVQICAGHQANMVLRLILGISEA